MKQSTHKTPSLRLAGKSADENNKRRKRLTRPHLINSLNRINFSDGEVTLLFKHKKYPSVISLQARPQVCSDNDLHCLWNQPVTNPNKMKFYSFDGLTFTDGYKQIQVPAELVQLCKDGVRLRLPENSFETYCRKIKRYECEGISAQISQQGWFVVGRLTNFSALAISVTFCHDFSLLKNEINPELPVNIVLKKNSEYIFSGTCSIIRQENRNDEKILVLKPEGKSVQRMKSKEYRSDRLVLNPLPTIVFQHPIIEKKITLGLNDISGGGFSVEEDEHDSVLLPGMVIPEMNIQFMHGFSIQCKTQVLYRIYKDDAVKCGFVILDIHMRDHLKLSSLIHQAKNKNSFISTTNIDIEALWNFFFESGFIYPEKYQHLAAEKENFITTYKELYNEHPEIVQQIIYQDKGKIYGHISIHRCYSKTWLLHHLAAIKSTKHKAGLVVLEHIFKHINELHSFPSANMAFLAGYFRPNNRFSNRLFGPGTVRSINDLNKCSVDEFAYLHHDPDQTVELPSSSWNLCEADSEDLTILKHWYSQVSGGLSIRALDLDPDKYQADLETTEEYLAAGFTRDRKLLALKKDDELVAIVVANIADFGLNMSDLTNCIQVFVLDQKSLQKDILRFALQNIANFYQNKQIPVLLFPKTYADDQEISYEKTYMLGILNLRYINDYLEFKSSLTTSRKAAELRKFN